jgi:hypothetical protein
MITNTMNSVQDRARVLLRPPIRAARVTVRTIATLSIHP